MAEPRSTIFQRLTRVMMGNSAIPKALETKTSIPGDAVIFSTNDKSEYENKLRQYRQQKLLTHQWVKTNKDINMADLSRYTAVKLMYRDVDLMDGCPEIAAGLDAIAQEACITDSKGRMLHVRSKSSRVEAILKDLYFNRLDVNTWLPLITRATVKYGNEFFLLNVTKNYGVLGWRELPVYDMDRVENGFLSQYMVGDGAGYNSIQPDEVKFVWEGHNESAPFKNWQVAHFRLLNDSFFLPYGTSHLHKSRRAWRMWSMMEDAMLIHRLDKSIERRVFKIYVGGIDDADVEAYVQSVADNFKRAPFIDPATGQVDLRKNFLDVSSDFFIPVRDPNQPSPIETLQGANNQTSMNDIEYMQNKILCGMRVPKPFLNFQDSQGKGQNLSLIDVRFARMVNTIQRFILLELQKIGQIHLYLLGLKDDMTNFTISLNNPSAQLKSLELDELAKKLGVLQTALADPGNGIPMMSLRKALREIMDYSDKEIMEMLNEIRLEKAMAAELMMTPNIIRKTGMFDPTDRIYGDFDAMNSEQQINPMQQQEGMGLTGGAPAPGGMMGGGTFGGGFGDSTFDLGEPGAEEGPDINGTQDTMGMENAPAADNGGPENLMETKARRKVKSFTERYFDLLRENMKNDEDYEDEDSDIEDFEGRTKTIQENSEKILSQIDSILSNTDSIITEEKENAASGETTDSKGDTFEF